MNEADKCELKPAPRSEAETTLDCPVRKLTARVQRFYHFYSRGGGSTYRYLSAAFCERENECRSAGVYDRCPLIKEMMEEND